MTKPVLVVASALALLLAAHQAEADPEPTDISAQIALDTFSLQYQDLFFEAI